MPATSEEIDGYYTQKAMQKMGISPKKAKKLGLGGPKPMLRKLSSSKPNSSKGTPKPATPPAAS